MSILYVILVIVLLGLLMYAINRWIPMADNFKSILNFVVVIFLIVWLLGAFGVFDMLRGVTVNSGNRGNSNRGVGCSVSEVGR